MKNTSRGLNAAKPVEAKTERGYVATLKWIEPFATKKPQTLRIETRVWPGAKNRTWAFMCVSPNEPVDPIWNTMRSVRDAFVKTNPPAATDGAGVKSSRPQKNVDRGLEDSTPATRPGPVASKARHRMNLLRSSSWLIFSSRWVT